MEMHPVASPHPGALDLEDLHLDPIEQFRTWLDAAESAGIRLPNAIALASADATGAPAVRHVLLRGLDERGFVFFTNRESRKGRHLAENPRSAFAVYWRELDRQVGVTGTTMAVDDDESDAYFSTRPREAQIGAWASRQSTVIGTREELMADYAMHDAEHRGEVARPSFWGGYRLSPETIEFWQGREHRLHDRFLYTRDAASPSGWRIDRLSP